LASLPPSSWAGSPLARRLIALAADRRALAGAGELAAMTDEVTAAATKLVRGDRHDGSGQLPVDDIGITESREITIVGIVHIGQIPVEIQLRAHDEYITTASRT
jgi:hypothetical protein